MYLQTRKYLCILCFELSFIMLDIILNIVTETIAIRKSSIALLLAYIIQDAFQLLAITVLCINIFRTNVFKTGFVELLVDRFRVTMLIAALYLLLTIGLQTHTLLIRWSKPLQYNWPSLLIVLYVSQRAVSVIHYYLYKRAALRLSDPRYYNEEWVKHNLTQD